MSESEGQADAPASREEGATTTESPPAERAPLDLGRRAVARAHPGAEHHSTLDVAPPFRFSR